MKHSRLPLLSLAWLLFGCSAGDAGVTPPTELDQSPPLNAQAPPLNPNAAAQPELAAAQPELAALQRLDFAEESALILAEAMCAQAQACTAAGTPVEVLSELCGLYAICAANLADPNCELDASRPRCRYAARN